MPVDGDKYAQYLADMVSRQVAPKEELLQFVQQVVTRAVSLCPGCWNFDTCPFTMRHFGSRVYEVALPSSDLDIVCELFVRVPPHTDARTLAKDFMKYILQCVSDSGKCQGIKNVIECNTTIRFSLASGLFTDLSAHVGADPSDFYDQFPRIQESCLSG